MVSIKDDILESYLVPKYELHIMPTCAYVSPPEGKLRWTDNKHPLDITKMKAKGSKIKTNLRGLSQCNTTGKKIYTLADGERTGEEIYAELVKKNNLSYGAHKESVIQFMRGMLGQHHIELSPRPQKTNVKMTGSHEIYYPIHLSMELTSACNLRCIHCYGSFGKPKNQHLDTEKVISFLSQMKAQGLKVVELTGGECTMHPGIVEIVEWCGENLELSCLLTNGTVMTEKLHAVLAKYAQNVGAQLCINGNEETHNTFVKSSTAYKKAMKCLHQMLDDGLLVRTPMNVCLDNYKQVYDTGKTLLEAGSAIFMVNYINERLGRAKDMSSGCFDQNCKRMKDGKVIECDILDNFKEMLGDINEQLEELKKEYPFNVVKERSEDEQLLLDYDKSCGAGRRSFYIASTGDVLLCPMSAGNDLPVAGNILENSLDEICRSDFARVLSKVSMPHPAECMLSDGSLCKKLPMDQNCILNGFVSCMENPHEECPWAEKNNIQFLIDKGRECKTMEYEEVEEQRAIAS